MKGKLKGEVEGEVEGGREKEDINGRERDCFVGCRILLRKDHGKIEVRPGWGELQAPSAPRPHLLSAAWSRSVRANTCCTKWHKIAQKLQALSSKRATAPLLSGAQSRIIRANTYCPKMAQNVTKAPSTKYQARHGPTFEWCPVTNHSREHVLSQDGTKYPKIATPASGILTSAWQPSPFHPQPLPLRLVPEFLPVGHQDFSRGGRLQRPFFFGCPNSPSLIGTTTTLCLQPHLTTSACRLL